MIENCSNITSIIIIYSVVDTGICKIFFECENYTFALCGGRAVGALPEQTTSGVHYNGSSAGNPHRGRLPSTKQITSIYPTNNSLAATPSSRHMWQLFKLLQNTHETRYHDTSYRFSQFRFYCNLCSTTLIRISETNMAARPAADRTLLDTFKQNKYKTTFLQHK